MNDDDGGAPVTVGQMSTDFVCRLRRYARRRLGDEASAQDAVQTTLEALLLARVPFRGDSSYLTYATGILRHKIGDTLRERRRYVHDAALDEGDVSEFDAVLDFLNVPNGDGFTSPERHVHLGGLRHALARAVQELSPRSRQILMMRERMGLDGVEMAERLGLTMSNTWVLLCRARRDLRASLRGQGYGPRLSGACDA